MHSSHPYRGAILLLALVFLGVFMLVSTALVHSFTTYSDSEQLAIAQTQALAIAEAGIDQAAYQLNQNTSYTGEANTTLGPGAFTVTVTNTGASTKQITATGYVPNRTNPKATRTVTTGVGINASVISFRYGVQVGSGGFVMNGGASINGSVYSNGSIVATNGVHITGSATAANAAATTTDQTNATPYPISSCTSSTCITFGNASATQDLAQSFKISTATNLNSIEFYIKKVSTPSNATVRIVNDNAGSPSTDVVLSGTLSAAAVTSSFGWVSVPLPATPVLDPAQTYWVVLDAGSSSTKYYVIGANAGGYANGVAKIGQYGSSWSNTTPSGLDSYFNLYLGGTTSLIGGDSNSGGAYIGTASSDNAWAHTIQGTTVTGTLYCQVGSNNTKACTTSSADPTPAAMPLSDGNIQAWKDDAATGGVTTGNVTVGSAGATLGPTHITGNLLVDGGGTLTISGTLWVDGSVTVNGGAKVKLASSYGANDGAIVSDGTVSVSGGGTFAGSGTAGSYPFLITTSACPAEAGCNGANAVDLNGGAGTVAIIAQNGNASIVGGSALKEITAKQVLMNGGATLTYDSGLISANFSSGPGGSWAFIPGTYAITR